jgi:hypothetical protein
MPAIKISSSSCETDVNSSWIKRQKYKLKIDLDEEETGAMKTYTTGDLIEGTAIIMFHCDTRYDDIEIVLEGTASHTKDMKWL